jgi:hypothetical protein
MRKLMLFGMTCSVFGLLCPMVVAKACWIELACPIFFPSLLLGFFGALIVAVGELCGGRSNLACIVSGMSLYEMAHHSWYGPSFSPVLVCAGVLLVAYALTRLCISGLRGAHGSPHRVTGSCQ